MIAMVKDDREILEVLQSELDFVEQGGYGRSVRTPWVPKPIFQNSPTCLNYGYANRAHPCSECHSLDFVDPEQRSEAVPCHHIRLNEAGLTIDELESEGKESRAQDLVRKWLRKQIDRIASGRLKACAEHNS